MKRKLVSLVLCMSVAATLLVGCGGSKSDSSSTNSSSEVTSGAASSSVTGTASSSTDSQTASVDKKNIKFYGKCVEYTSGPMMTDALEKKLADTYKIDSIQIDWANQDKVIRTGIASGEPCDIYNYTPGGTVSTFADMAIDLKPYLDADPEFKSFFSDSELQAGTTADGRIVNLPWELNYTVVLANKTLLDKIGVTIPDAWTYDDFKVIAKKIQDAGYFPLAACTDLGKGSWLYRNAMLSECATSGILNEYAAGSISYKSDESIRALTNVKSLYDAKLLYPGDGAVTLKTDEMRAAFYQGKVAMITEIAAGAKTTAADADFDVIAIPWPSSATVGAINGGCNGFFIPQNCSDVDAAVAVLKAFLSADIQKIHADQGYMPANVNVEITDPFVKLVQEQSATLTTQEPPSTPELNDYLANTVTSDLVLGGGVDATADALEAIRTTK